VAGKQHDVALRQSAKEALNHPPVTLIDEQLPVVVEGFAEACRQSSYRLYGCAVMPDHVHLVIDRHARNIRQIVGHLKGQATLALKRAGYWSHDERPIWSDHGWNVFLDDVAGVQRAIRYVDDNPLKEGKPRQTWSIVSPYLI
jgi:REP element-mobilizing transposase RayT